MSIGTSLGGFFKTPMEFQTTGKDFNSIDPEITPDLNTRDQNELRTKDLLNNLNSEPDPNNKIPVSDIEDRRDESLMDKASAFLSQNFSKEKLQFIMEHPNPLDEQSFNYWKTQKNTLAQPEVPESSLGDELGLKSIK